MPPTHYTHGHHESVLRSHAWRTAANSAAYLLPHLASGMSLLDVGAGPGTITIDLAARLAPGRVVAIDPAEPVVQAAQAAAAVAGSSVHFDVGDIYTYRQDGPPFDVVHAHQVLQHLPDPIGALRAMRALGSPGGIVAARDADYGAMFWHPRLPELDDWQRLYRDLARRNGGEPDAARLLPAWARAAGFTEISVIPEMWAFTTPAERAWWGDMWAARIIESAMAEQVVTEGLATRDDLERISDGWRQWAADPDGFFAVPNTAILATM